MAAVTQLEPAEARDLLAQKGETCVLLDVREPWECAQVRLEGALHIPMGEIAGRLAELNSDRTYVVMCHHGGRSQQVALFLGAKGYQVANLKGGIDAWAAVLDPRLPRY